jgi:L-amino acid N-acyltransferase YncA
MAKGEFSLGLFKLAAIFPEWSYKFNKAFILENKISSMQVPKQLNESVHVRIATNQDIETIVRISKWNSDRIANLMNSGAVCFLSSVDGHPPGSLTWVAFGECYVRGMAYQRNFPEHSMYGVSSITLPEFRRQGLYLQMNKSITEYANEFGMDTYVVLVEFTNTYSLSLFKKLGFTIVYEIIFIKLLFLRISVRKELATNKLSFKVLVREPRGKVTII